MKILVLGSKGQLGRCLTDQLKMTDHEVTFTSREQIDIADFELTKSQIKKISPYLIINATAYTEVDKAEEDQKNANLINHLAVKNIAEVCNQKGCWLIHVSTDFVFDGAAKTPYKESDKTNPQGVYGETKYNGELAVKASGCKYIILRTAWVFSEYGNNFLKTMLRLGADRDELSIVGDQIGCPTYAQDLAKSVVEIVPQLYSRDYGGLYHYCGDQSCSWYDFAKAIFDQATINNLKIPSKVNSIETSAYPAPAKRPAYSVLNCSKIEKDFGVQASNWRDAIEKVTGKLKLESLMS